MTCSCVPRSRAPGQSPAGHLPLPPVSHSHPQRTQNTTRSMRTNKQCEVPILFSYHAHSTALIYYIKRGEQFLETGTNP